VYAYSFGEPDGISRSAPSVATRLLAAAAASFSNLRRPRQSAVRMRFARWLVLLGSALSGSHVRNSPLTPIRLVAAEHEVALLKLVDFGSRILDSNIKQGACSSSSGRRRTSSTRLQASARSPARPGQPSTLRRAAFRVRDVTPSCICAGVMF
jgi:hypothetical protein